MTERLVPASYPTVSLLIALLELRYLCFYSWEKIAVEMDYDLRYMHKLYRKALEQYTAFIPAGEE
ncbi:hypothetical protein B5G33_13490 [Blautia sp. An81]|nr:hypothetical protein B5G33_13490 [Blautia sp. An81]